MPGSEFEPRSPLQVKRDIQFECPVFLFILENYPGDDGPTEVWVRKDHFGKETEYNGMRCLSNFFYKVQYDWKRESDGLLEVLRRRNCNARPLARGRFTLREFQEMMGDEDWVYSHTPDWGPFDSEEEDEEGTLVLNHTDYPPDDTNARRLRYLIIDKRGDGSYVLRSEISVKYPTYGEMFDEAANFGIPDGETLVLPVDVEEVLMCAEDINKAVCAFRIAGNVVETFGQKEGLLAFEALLREALASGRCTVPEED